MRPPVPPQFPQQPDQLDLLLELSRQDRARFDALPEQERKAEARRVLHAIGLIDQHGNPYPEDEPGYPGCPREAYELVRTNP